MAFVGNLLRWALLAALFLGLAVFTVRAVQAFRGPPLMLWHTYIPDDAIAADIDRLTWPQWMEREKAVFAAVQRDVVAKTSGAQQIPQNRYWAKSPVNPANLATDWNRSFTLDPTGPAQGSVVLLHGMTDAPYSLRHIASLYQSRGFHVVAVRLPGHGTVPAGLTSATMDDWQAATRLAVREAVRRSGPDRPLHLVGYSNGGALAIRHALAAIADPTLGRPTQLVLLSPMVGLTPFARFAGIAKWPAFLPAFAAAAWLDTWPEYNPFKYNSFPVAAAVQAHALTVATTADMTAARSAGRLIAFPPTLAFQSAVDTTVSSRAVVTGLFDLLPKGAHGLTLFDINRAARVGPLLRPSAAAAIDTLITPGPRAYTLTIVTNSAAAPDPVLRIKAAGGTTETTTPLGIPWPVTFHSLSHIALPFPPSDGLYGADPDPADPQGVNLGALATRGENATLAISMETLSRASSNPFYPWMMEQIASRLPASSPVAAVAAKTAGAGRDLRPAPAPPSP